jgi:hypothetical protein
MSAWRRVLPVAGGPCVLLPVLSLCCLLQLQQHQPSAAARSPAAGAVLLPGLPLAGPARRLNTFELAAAAV